MSFKMKWSVSVQNATGGYIIYLFHLIDENQIFISKTDAVFLYINDQN